MCAYNVGAAKPVPKLIIALSPFVEAVQFFVHVQIIDIFRRQNGHFEELSKAALEKDLTSHISNQAKKIIKKKPATCIFRMIVQIVGNRPSYIELLHGILKGGNSENFGN